MISNMMRSVLLIFLCALVSSQARTLTEQRDHSSRKPPSLTTGVVDYHRPGVPPPPAPKPWNPPFIEMITTRSKEHNYLWIMKNYGREEHTISPPSPKEAPPTHQVTGGGGSAVEWEENKLGKMHNYGRDEHRSPPSPKEAPPTHQVTGRGGVVAPENFGKKGGGLPPPSPKEAPPTHQVTGGGVVAPEYYGKKGGGLPPPTPQHAPPTHQVSGGGAAALEQSWPYVLLSASA